MHFNLKILNLLIGLCDESAKLPSLFWENGYEMAAIEPRIRLGKNRECVPEIMLASFKSQNTILVECKAGRNTEIDQLERYREVTPALLASRFSDLQAAARTLDVALIGKADELPRLQIGPQRLNWKLPLLTYDETAGVLALRDGIFSVSALNQPCRTGLSIPAFLLPTGYVPYDWESTNLEIAANVLPIVLQFILKRQPRFGVVDVCQQSHLLWHYMHTDAKSQLQKKVALVLDDLCDNEFEDVFSRKRKYSLYQLATAYRSVHTKVKTVTRRFLKKAEAAQKRMSTPAKVDPQLNLFNESQLHKQH